jgi:hypothetical protein
MWWICRPAKNTYKSGSCLTPWSMAIDGSTMVHLPTLWPSISPPFFPYDSKILRDGDEIDIRDEVRGAVSYIANELLENAVKFNNADPGHAIVLKLMLFSDRILFIATNYIDIARAKILEAFIHEIADADPDQLYIDKLEHSAINGDDSESGLGILTIINDYQARIGWRLEPEQAADGSESTEPEAIVLTVMVNLPLPQPS